MTYAPAKLLELRAFLKPITGLSDGNLGIVGDTAHATRGTSYHLGADQLTEYAYSRITPRDKAGLTNAASALDIGDYRGLRTISLALVAYCRANGKGTSDIREIIFSPDGDRVLRWDRERGYALAPYRMASNTLNNSHRWHTHVSWYRDSQKRDKVGVFRALDTTGDDMSALKVTPTGTIHAYIIRTAAGAPAVTTYGPNQGERGSLAGGFVGNGLGVYGIDGLGGRRAFLLGNREYVAEADVSPTKWERTIVSPPPDVESESYPVVVAGKFVGEVQLP